VVNYANNKVEADKVVGEIEAAGGRAIAIQADYGPDLRHGSRSSGSAATRCWT
jgi:hypothetical protein